MKQGYRKKPNRFTEIAQTRILELFKQAEIRFKKYPEFSDRYVEIARKISMKYKVKIPGELKKRFCKNCHKYLVHGVNCRVRLTGNKVVYTCLSCKKHMRLPLSEKQQ